MPNKKSNTRALRQLAENLIRQLVGEDELWKQDYADLATSLVRQWITCDGHATLLQGDRQFYFHLGHSPLGKACVGTECHSGDWLKQFAEQWQVAAEDLPDIIERLNRGQSAEVTNAEGCALRFWMNPKDRSKGVEPLVKTPLPPGWRRDHRKIAADVLNRHLGALLDEAEKEELAGSLARQWQRYQGHACLFVGTEQVVFTFTEKEEGECNVSVGHARASLEPQLSSLGLAPEVIPEAVAHINLDQEFEFRDHRGIRSRLWHDPRTRQLCVRPLDSALAATGPLCCPRCSGLLKFWQAGERQQVCPCCGNSVSF